jgi:hypothetical protein
MKRVYSIRSGRIWTLPPERWPPARRVPLKSRQNCRVGDRRSTHRAKSLVAVSRCGAIPFEGAQSEGEEQPLEKGLDI